MSDDIERVALALFDERGFDAVTVQELAAAADISERTFFRYFPTKHAVLRRELDRRVAQLQDLLDAQPPEASAIVAARGALVEMAALYEADRERIQVWSRVIAAAPSVVTQLGAYHLAFHGSVTELIAERLGVDPENDLRAERGLRPRCSPPPMPPPRSGWRTARVQPLVPMVEAAVELVEQGLHATLRRATHDRRIGHAGSA